MEGSVETSVREDYEQDGFCFPIEAMTPDEALGYRRRLEDAEAVFEGDADSLGAVRNHCNLVLDFVDEITRRPSLTELVSELLGPDLLVWGCSFFIKNPDSPEYVSWHQDLTYWGLDGLHEVTAWVAFSPATPDNGCMRFLPGSHRQPIVEHQDTFASENLLSRGQEVAVPVDEVRAPTAPPIVASGSQSVTYPPACASPRGSTPSPPWCGARIATVTLRSPRRPEG